MRGRKKKVKMKRREAYETPACHYWRDVVGFEDYYAVSNNGQVYSKKKDMVLKSCVDHKDECKTNNFIYVNPDGTINHEKSNLEWCNQSYNVSYGTSRARALATSIKNGTLHGSTGRKGKPVIQYDQEMNEISRFESLTEAAKTTSINISGICGCCNGKYRARGGYIWRYA